MIKVDVPYEKLWKGLVKLGTPYGKLWNGLKNLGYNQVENVSVGKYIELSVNAKNENECETKINEACEQFLANPLIEEYTIKIKSL